MIRIFALLVLVLSNAALAAVKPEADVLSLDATITALLDEKIRPLRTQKARLAALHILFYDSDHLNIQYFGDTTKTATETFYARGGNCVSLANLFVAAARHVGLTAHFQSVDIARAWFPLDGYYEVPGHINVLVTLPRETVTVEFNQAYFSQLREDRVKREKISDTRALAEYYNNRGVETLTDGDAHGALALLAKAQTLAPDFDPIWSNMGVAYKALNDSARAESHYLHALQLNKSNMSALRNLYLLYLNNGEASKADDYARRAEHYAMKNPYHLKKLALKAMGEKHYGEAIRLLKRAIRIYREEPEFHHELAIAYYHDKQPKRSARALAEALRRSETAELRAKYQWKLDALSAR